MNRLLFVLFLVIVLPFGPGVLSSNSDCSAEEPAEEFLQALRDAGYYDVAIDYLTRAASSELVSDEFKKVLPFEKAETLIDSTAQIRDIKQWEPRLDEAEKLLNQYANSIDDPSAAARVVRFQGNLQYKRARIYLLQSESDRLTADEKVALQKKTRDKFGEALEKYKQARQGIRELIDNYQIDPEDPNSESGLKKLRGTYTQVRVRLPLVTEQLADSHPEGSTERTKFLNEALAEYSDLFKKYDGYKAGLDACLFSGRCFQKLNQHSEAISRFEEVFKLGDSSAVKPLKKKAMVLAAASWPKVDPYPYESVIQYLTGPVSLLNRREEREPDWMRVKLELAKALHMKAELVKKEKRTGASGEANELNKRASKLARGVARIKNPHQELAQKWMSEWNISFTAGPADDLKPPASFDEARQRGKDMISDIEIAMKEVYDAKKNKSTEAEISVAQSQLVATADSAMQLFDTALLLTNDETPRVDINNVRYLQSYCHFAKDRFLESAIIGEFLLEKYPTVDWTRQSSSLMIKSYAQLYDSSEADEKEFYKNRLLKVGKSSVNRWPGSNEAISAATRLASVFASSGDLENADKYLKKLPADSRDRLVLSSQLAQRLWIAYTKAKKANPGDPSLPEKFNVAKQYLADSVKVSSVDEVNYPIALCSLFLIDAYLEANDAGQAVNHLENSIVSPVELIKIGHASIQNPKVSKTYRFATHQGAIKTYLAAMRTSNDPTNEIEKINNSIKAMTQESDGSATDQQKLTRVYRSIAVDIESQFELQPSIEKKKSFATTVNTFFEQVVRGSKDTPTLLWAGDTLLNMAESLSLLGAVDTSKELSKLAIESLDAIDSSSITTDRSKLQHQQLLALAKRGSGQYQAAIDQFGEILRSKNGLTQQIEAAKTLHFWGLKENKKDKLAMAMMGTMKVKNPKTKRESNLIWGWRRLVDYTRGKEAAQDAYRECLYHSVECRFRYGKLDNNNPKAIKSAKNELEKALARYDFLKQGPWTAKFESLLKEMQAAQ